MDFSQYFPIFHQLTPAQQQKLLSAVTLRSVKKGDVVHNGAIECTGLVLVRSGQLRAYMLSSEGREITLYRLFDRDICLLSAACMISSLQFEVTISAEKDTDVYIVSPVLYKQLMQESVQIANYTNELMATRFSEVMWLVEQIMWNSLDKRVASFLLEESLIEGTPQLKITHETIANHLGTHREVITRMLRYFQSEGMVRLTRGAVEITNARQLEALCKA